MDSLRHMAQRRAARKRTAPVSGGRRVLRYDGRDINFELIYSRRRTLAIQVRPDTSVIVRAPLGSKLDTIDHIVLTRGAWIVKQQKKFATYGTRRSLTRQYADGELHPYLGREIPLRVIACNDERVMLEGDMLTAFVRDVLDAARVERMIRRWYRQQAGTFFEERLRAWLPVFEQRGIHPPKTLTLRDMKSRWGSCSARGRVTLNVRLMHVAPELIDYVIVHELCHLKELNHGKGFYALLGSIMPDWKARRDALYQVELS